MVVAGGTPEVGRVPSSTYRLQITARFTLGDAARWVGYLSALGVGWVYTSPLLAAEPGSDHGYDVIDHSRTDPARGGRAGLAALAGAAHARGMGLLVDIVPNHVGVASPLLSVWWRDVLTRGRESPFAAAFDIDWAAGGGKILLPVLGDDDEAALTLDGQTLRYHEHVFPLAPGTVEGNAEAVHQRQHYRLVGFRLADTRLNYRRFFAVNSLAGIRVEDPVVFARSHAEIARWCQAGWVDGLRVDHPDGLAHPGAYLDALAGLSGGRYTVVEKILADGEDLAGSWGCDGTTGYDALALIDRVFVDPDGAAALDELDTMLRGAPADWQALVHAAKRELTDGWLGSEVNRLLRVLPRPAGCPPGEQLRDAIAELLANFAVYRTYQPAADPALPDAIARARDRRPDLREALDVVGGAARETGTEFAVRLQQTSGSVMAKSVEDRAFYRYPRLVSLTEVGGDPSRFSLTVAEFHEAQHRRQRDWPRTMTTLSTHDTKRGEDVRARIDVLSEVASEWAESVQRWLGLHPLPDPVLANLLLQTAVGAWPLDRQRLHAYAVKAAREAAVATGWIDGDAAFEDALDAWVNACYDDPAWGDELAAFADGIRPAGWSNALAAKLIQLTGPGVPDVYLGTELWRDDLVDPDNRRPFDALAPGGAAELLARLDEGYLPPVDATGAAKLLVTSRALRARRDRPELFTGYRPVPVRGPAADHAIAFDRGGALTVATRLPLGLERRGGWGGTVIELPEGGWRDALTGRAVPAGGTAELDELLRQLPVALLLRE